MAGTVPTARREGAAVAASISGSAFWPVEAGEIPELSRNGDAALTQTSPVEQGKATNPPLEEGMVRSADLLSFDRIVLGVRRNQ